MKKVLISRGGGGLTGLDLHAGMWMAMQERGIIPTHLIGNSAGAITSAFHAVGNTADEFMSLISVLKDDDVLDPRFMWKFRILWLKWISDIEKTEHILKCNLSEDWSDYKIRFETVTCDIRDWTKVTLGESQDYTPIDAVIASMSISGYFPWKQIGDRFFTDGGVRANLPLPRNWKDYDEVYLLIASGRHYTTTSDNILSRLLANIRGYSLDQIYDVLEIVRGESHPNTEVHVLWPPFEVGRCMNFDHTLIEKAYHYTKDMLE